VEENPHEQGRGGKKREFNIVQLMRKNTGGWVWGGGGQKPPQKGGGALNGGWGDSNPKGKVPEVEKVGERKGLSQGLKAKGEATLKYVWSRLGVTFGKKKPMRKKEKKKNKNHRLAGLGGGGRVDVGARSGKSLPEKVS